MNDINPSRRPSDDRPALRPLSSSNDSLRQSPSVQVQSQSVGPDVPPMDRMKLQEPSDSLQVKTPKRWFTLKKGLIVFAITLLLITAIGAVGVFVWYQQNLAAVQPGSDEMVKITIEQGSDPEDIASLLKTNELIRSEIAFSWYVRMEGKSGLLQAGSYRLGKGEDVSTMVAHLTSGNTDTFSITFIPGKTLADHRQVLIGAGYDDATVDTALAKSYDSPLFAGKPTGADLEGYIYGETFNFAATATPEDILTYIFEYFENVVQEENLVAQYKARGYNLYEGLTLASIIEREVITNEDAAQVAQVFELRLKMDMPLGSDPTYQYIADKLGEERDINFDSPYNTRRYKGLPPGPIASPGLASLRAVANPAEGDYLYFLSGDDDKTYFSRTFEEHEQNIRDHCQKKCQII